MPGSKLFNLGFNQKKFGGNNKIAGVSINLGNTKGRGSSTRMFNYCNQHSANPFECINQFINITPLPLLSPSPLCEYTFSGNGDLTQEKVNSYFLNGGTAQKICIEGYETIGRIAFQNNSQITSITIGESVTSIGSYAFDNCSSLSSITFGENVTSIVSYAFYRCSMLSSIIIPTSVTSISDNTFELCTSLSSITFGENVTSIGIYAFSGCSMLSSIKIPDSVTSIGIAAFFKCSSLSSITFGENVTSIGSYAFYRCSGLSSIIIPTSVTSIGEDAFLNSGLTTVTIANGQLNISSPEEDVDFFGTTVETVLP